MRYKKGVWSRKQQTILIMTMEGKTQDEIKDAVGYQDRSAISRIQAKEEFQNRLEESKKKSTEAALEIFEGQAKTAANKIVKISKTGTVKDRMQYEASKEILYMIGCKPVEIIEQRGRNYTPEEIEAAYVTMKEVEATANRLIGKKSRFVLDKTEKTPLLAPVPDHIESKDTNETESTKSTGEDRP